MLRIGNIDGLADIAPAQGSTAKSRTSEKRAAKTDTVEMSTEAQQAAQIFKIAGNGVASSEIRQEVVEAARKRIEEGTYRLQGVVTLVASRLTRYV